MNGLKGLDPDVNFDENSSLSSGLLSLLMTIIVLGEPDNLSHKEENAEKTFTDVVAGIEAGGELEVWVVHCVDSLSNFKQKGAMLECLEHLAFKAVVVVERIVQILQHFTDVAEFAFQSHRSNDEILHVLVGQK